MLVVKIAFGVALGGILLLLILAAMEWAREALEEAAENLRGDWKIRNSLKSEAEKIADESIRAKAMVAIGELDTSDTKQVNVILNRITEILNEQQKEKV